MSCLLAIDKPLGMTSHDVVGRVRRALGERRVGHAGTLDPDASGVLVVGIGTATRLLGMLALDDKRYDALIAFGSETDTDDAQGVVTREAEVPPRLAEPAVAQVVVASLVGTSEQVPPAYSAISVGGKRSYERARAGQEVELPARTVTIFEAALNGVPSADPLVWDCSLRVSKGTYVRSIARDLGRSMGTAAHLCGLRRSASGPVELADCITLEELAEGGAAYALSHALDPVSALRLPRHRLVAQELRRVQVGSPFPCPDVQDERGGRRTLGEGERVCLVCDGLLMGVWERRGPDVRCVANFAEGVRGVRA